MTSVTFPTALGGDGSTVSDDADPTTGLRNAGYKTRFVPALQQTVNMTQTTVNNAAAAAASEAVTVTKAAEAMASELAAAGYANAAAQVSTGFDTLRPKIRPALNLDFVNQEFVDRRVVVSRAGPKSYFGKRKVLGDENLLRFSEQFDNSVWAKVETTCIANTQLAPDGSNTADVVAESIVSSAHVIQENVSVTIGDVRYFSVYLKKGSGGTAPNIVQLTFVSNGFGSSQYANFNINAGTVGTVVGLTAGIEAAANGFYRCWILGTATASAFAGGALAFTNNNDSLGRVPSYSGSTTSDVIVWGAQLESARTGQTKPTAYVRTTDYPVRTFFNALETAAANVMPVEYDPVTQQCLGIKPESQATNLLTFSEDFNNAAWQVTTSLATKDSVVDLKGNLTAKRVNSGFYRHSNYATVNGTTYVNSIWIKRVSGSAVVTMRTANNVAVDVTSQIVGLNVWHRVFVSAASSLATGSNGFFIVEVAGDGLFDICFAQAEASTLGVPSSYIPTTTAQVTRLADNLTVPVSEFDYNQKEGSLYAEVNTPVAIDSGINLYIATLSDQSTNNSISFRRDDAGSNSLRLRSATVSQAITQEAIDGVNGDFVANQTRRILMKFSENDISLFSNGSLIGSDTNANIPSNITTLTIGAIGTGANQFNGYIRCLRYYNAALSSAEAQALSKV